MGTIKEELATDYLTDVTDKLSFGSQILGNAPSNSSAAHKRQMTNDN